MVIRFTKHALQQIKIRDIDKSDIIDTLNNPDKTIKDKIGNEISQKKYGDYLLRVYFNLEDKDKLF